MRRVSENLIFGTIIEDTFPNIRNGRYIRIAVPRLVVRVTDIVDANPKREERVRVGPLCIGRLASGAVQELIHLIRERENSRFVRGHKGRINSGSAVGVVEREDSRPVVLDSVYVDPVGASDSCEALLHC